MCDYSLHAVSSRPARVGDRLVTTQFIGSITRGLAAVTDPHTAVCLLPGTEVAFEHDAKYAHPVLWFRSRTIKERLARFRQINRDNPQTHHDALEFPSGRLILVTRLAENQRLTVLQLPVIDQHSTDAVPSRQVSSSAA